MRYIFIVNPTAGKSDAKLNILPSLQKQMEDMNIPYSVEVTGYPGHATEIAQKHAKAGQEVTFFAVGGDGTFNEVLKGAYKYKNAVVACVPCGSGNDFVKYYSDTPSPFLDMEDYIKGEIKTIDIVNVNGDISANICSAGLDAAVAYGIPKYRRIAKLGGSMAYNMSILECLLKPLGSKMQIEINGEKINGKYLMVCIGNGRFYGGGYKGAPIADINDGLLDVVLVKKISRFKILPVLLKYKKGLHMTENDIIPKYKGFLSFYRTDKIKITTDKSFIINLDGECSPANTLEAQIMPSAARVLIPKSVCN